MNQILYVQEKQNSAPIDTKKIVLFFAVSIIIFGLVLAGEGISSNISGAKKNAELNSNPIEENIPSIMLTKTEDNQVIIDVESTVQISHIIYNWNNEAAQTIETTGKTNIEETIDIPTGENTLNISVIDINGKETSKQETYIVEQSKPVIELFSSGSNIKIKVTSDEELAYVSYKWNLEEETKEDMTTYEDKTKYEKTIKVPEGQNTLKVVAVNVSQMSTEKSMEIKGAYKEEAQLEANATVRGKYLEFSVTAEENIKSVEFTFNGKKYLMNKEYTFGDTKTVHYKLEMEPGMNYLKVVTTTESDKTKTGIWKYEYQPY